MTDIQQITAPELARRLAAGDPVQLLDVREDWEYAFNRIPGSRLCPMSQLPVWAAELDPAQEYVIYCHHGIRSMHACAYLRSKGFTRLVNLIGGIDAWSHEVDPTVPLY
ncbi:rhodanese-like domain-containing protein [Chloracidobacterium aggregatum]|jgi:rhodanese-related sulfurtransferase|uniref:Sulfurtransferase n=1 Tax=Chloracidobacterium sp. N TaxID=2821540 RepID=A0ABX8B5J9_9BACT|nr:rhodanese-like domain-containing protein [Chloracidobacterium aggregatum]QUV85337.1 sulfurtransferase [Chloracidobacterium sp. 2]QUV88262.1 sulfurtransferase [Chloracidobacterium sp. S]QUV91181.1 sulfurtransferase [Chloracidobacterium sp. A]QUV94366.1 sulfurtransferase [Chloracidobacterium sp. N]QUV97565.1 sulfurtransferase [Chloracidobacterium sp. E]